MVVGNFQPVKALIVGTHGERIIADIDNFSWSMSFMQEGPEINIHLNNFVYEEHPDVHVVEITDDDYLNLIEGMNV